MTIAFSTIILIKNHEIRIALNNITKTPVHLKNVVQITAFSGLLALIVNQPVAADNLNSDAERLFINAIEDVSHNRIDSAIKQLATLSQQAPKFTLAKLIYADLLAAQAGVISSMGNTSLLTPAKLKALQEEAKARVLYHQKQQQLTDKLLPKNLIQMTKDQEFAIVVDLTLSRLFLFANEHNVPYLVKDFYASSGKAGSEKQTQGDNKTPIGVYFITQRIPGTKLPPKYGVGALPINYPNSWDKQQNRTGHGIWVHGSPLDTYSRPPQASEGCISLTNDDFIILDNMVDIKSTPVVIGKNIEWITEQQWTLQQQQFNALIASWEQSWESRDATRYADNYSSQFNNGIDNYQSWTTRRTRANKARKFINIKLDNLSLFTYPDDKNLLVATFNQHYESNLFQSLDVKRQYWRFEDNRWKVVYEGEPSLGQP